MSATRDPGPTALQREDPRLQTARAVARHGMPSLTPQLDSLAALAGETTPGLGFAELLSDQDRERAELVETTRRALRVGDRIQVTVVGQSLFGGIRTVDADGWVEVPPLGAVRCAALSPVGLSGKLADMLAESYLQERPAVRVSLLEPSARSALVLGRVGLHSSAAGDADAAASSLVPLAPGRRTSLHELLGQARGLAADADRTRLQLLRQGSRPASDEDVSPRRCYHFSYEELAEAHLRGRDVWVHEGDQLLVPRLPDVYVHGAVERPGPHPLQPGTTVASAVLRAGGTPARGILLVGATGETWPAEPGAELTAGAVLFVPPTPRVNVVGPGVPRNGVLDLPPEGLTVLDAISQAGWFTPPADPDGVVILRRAGARRVRIEVPISDILDGSRSEVEFRLQPGDTVLVPEGVLGW